MAKTKTTAGRPANPEPKIKMQCNALPRSIGQFQDLAEMLGLVWGGAGSSGALVDYIGSLPAAKLKKLAEFMRELSDG